LKKYFFSIKKKIQYKLLLGDLILIVFSLFIASNIRVFILHGYFAPQLAWQRLHTVNLIFILVHPIVLYALGLYSPNQEVRGLRKFFYISWGTIVGGVIATAILFFVPKYLVGRTIILLHLTVLSFLLYAWRFILLEIVKSRNYRTTLALIGRGDIVSSFIEEINNDPHTEFEIRQVCIVDSIEKECLWLNENSMNVAPNVNELLSRNMVQALAVDTGFALTNDEIRQIIDFRFKYRKRVEDLTELYKNSTGKVPLSYIDGRWFMSNPGFQGAPKRRYLKLKRFIDVAIALIIGTLTLPLIILAAVCIKIDSKGSVIYKQERLGMDRTPFNCYKFRTMVKDAEKNKHPIHSKENDERVTRIGKILRKTRIDELPQLINILKGELSFVGPRPIREFFANSFSKKIPFYELRYNVKPGLTGWAQVHGCYAVPYGLEALQYELFYIEKMSLLMDLHILTKTVRTVLGLKGK